MTHSFDLSKLGSSAFENLINSLALKVLGSGSTGFCPGADGGRDGFFQGSAPYPSISEQWSGTWYIQSKFLAPHLSKDPQKWLIEQITKEIEAFDDSESERKWPDNWIIATNVDPSAVPKTGSFDKIKNILSQHDVAKNIRFDIWGGSKIINFLNLYPSISEYYSHFLTPGHVLTALFNKLNNKDANYEEIVRYFIVTQFSENLFTKLEQAGSGADLRPQVQDLFIDLPYKSSRYASLGILESLCQSTAECHKYSLRGSFPDAWYQWANAPSRARTYLIKGGPGQGKSTIGQYLSQIHRAYLILDKGGPKVHDSVKANAEAVKEVASHNNFWPTTARIPVQIELKEYAHWFSQKSITEESTSIISYISELISKKIAISVPTKSVKDILSQSSWIVIFDGLDEVPNDFKDEVANEVIDFINNLSIEIDGDILSICTSRPQGYSGQFEALDCPIIELRKLDTETAIECAKPLLKFLRSEKEAEASIEILQSAISSKSVQELMTTPLQSHIMAVVVRDGGRPPERRWQLFNSFYLTMKKRESQKNFGNQRINKLLREEEKLLRSVHMHLGFILHARAERSDGAQTTLDINEFKGLVRSIVTQLVGYDIEATVNDVMEATTERLVLVSTPDDGSKVRFDIRQLQEFFAAEFLYSGVSSDEIANRLEIIGGDAHWREVAHFILSALIENQRVSELALSIQSLRKLNEGHEDESNNLFYKKIGKGLMIAERLLSEGVLEQDQRDRQQIKPLFDTIGCQFDFDKLTKFVRITLPKSRQWLVNTILLEKVDFLNLQENIGILYLLGLLLPQESNKKDKVKTAFNSCSIKHQELLINKWANSVSSDFFFRTEKDYPELSDWVLEIAFDTLNSDKWLEYQPTTTSHLITLFTSNRLAIFSVLESQGFNLSISTLMFDIFDEEYLWQSEDSTDTESFGRFVMDFYNFNWINRKLPEKLESHKTLKNVEEVGGIFKLIFAIIDFSQLRSIDSLNTLIKLYDQAKIERIKSFPPALLATIPVHSQFSLTPFAIDHLRNLENDTQVEETINNLSITKPFSGFTNHRLPNGQHSTIDLEQSFPEFPSLLIILLLLPGYFSTDDKQILLPLVLETFSKHPTFLQQNVLNIGAIYEVDATAFSTIKQILSKLPYNFKDVFHYLGPRPVVDSFPLIFPDDLGVLPILANAYSSHIDSFSQAIMYYKNNKKKLPINQPELERLEEIYTNESISKDIRAAALALFWIFSKFNNKAFDSKDLIKYKQLYATLKSELNLEWLTGAFISSFLTSFSEKDCEATDFIQSLFEDFDSCYIVHERISRLIENWGERSHSPVTKNGFLDKWLAYQFAL